MPMPSPDTLEQDVQALWSLLFTIVLDGEKRLAAFMALHNLTPPQFYVLKTLMERGGRCPIGEIARAHHLTNATMTGLVGRLEALTPPLVERVASATDRRSVEVVLTDAGYQRFLAVQTDLMGQVRVLFGLLEPEERQQFIGFLQRYVMMVQVSMALPTD